MLVVGPLKVARGVWAAEAKHWKELADLPIAVAAGESAATRNALIGDLSQRIVTIGYETLADMYGKWGRNLPFDAIVMDESDKMKAPGSQRFKAHRHKLGLYAWRVAMTGTPAPNRLEELWAQLFCVDGGAAWGGSFTRWRAKWFRPTDYFERVWEPMPGSFDALMALAAPTTLSLTAEDCALDLPPLREHIIPIELPPAARKLYDQMRDEAIIRLGERSIAAAEQVAVAQKLLQIAAGFVYGDAQITDVGRVVRGDPIDVHSAKLDAFDGLYRADGQLLAFYAFEAQRDQVLSRHPDVWTLGHGARADDATIRRWQAGDGRCLLVHPASAGHGLNLHLGGGRRMVYLTPPHSGGLRTQSMGRLWRRGQTEPVDLYDLIATDTLDEGVLRALATKQKGESALIRALRELA